MKPLASASAAFGLALFATGPADAGSYISTPQAIRALEAVALSCDNGKWRNSMCNGALYGSAIILVNDFLAALDDAAVNIKDRYRVMLDCPPSQFEYQDEDVARACANAIMDTAKATGIEPDPVQFELLAKGHDAMNGSLETQAALEQTLDFYIPPDDAFGDFTRMDLPNLTGTIQAAMEKGCPDRTPGTPDSAFACVNAVWTSLYTISAAIDDYIEAHPDLKNAEDARIDLHRCEEIYNAMVKEVELLGDPDSLSPISLRAFLNKGITAAIDCMLKIDSAEENIGVWFNNEAQNRVLLQMNCLMGAKCEAEEPPRPAAYA